MRIDAHKVPDGWRLARLGDVAEVNPRRPRLNVPDDVSVTFLPMAAIAESSQGIIGRESRSYCDVATGYTYFEENDFLFSKITPCLQNGKHALATGLKRGFGFGHYRVPCGTCQFRFNGTFYVSGAHPSSYH